MSNGYPGNFIDSIVHRFLSKQFSNTDVGELALNKFAREKTLAAADVHMNAG